MAMANPQRGLRAHCIPSLHVGHSLPFFPKLLLMNKTSHGSRGLDSEHALTGKASLCGGTRSEQRRKCLCRAVNWAERLSRDLYGVGPHESGDDEEEGEPASLGRQRREERANKGIAALPSAFPIITERAVALPIDYYQILRADTHYLADAIVRAYEARINNVPQGGFSQDTLLARQEILRGACETLADPDLRGDYNQSLIDDEAGTVMVDVPWNKVPGALCLLQEVGEMEVVLRVGQVLLQERLGKSFRCDVTLAMALAYIDLSREAMGDSPKAIVHSCEMLENALKLLQDAGGDSLAPALQTQIDDTLQQIKPRCIIDVLSFPLDEDHKLQREVAVQDLRRMLWDVSEGGSYANIPGFSREEFMRKAFACMTAGEQVALFSSTPSDIPAEGSEVYTAALAHVAEGFVGKKPYLIQEADALFSQLQLTDATALSNDMQAPDGGPEFTLERGMCALLLGELDKCRAWLGLDDENSSYRVPAITEFIFPSSVNNGESDPLPGLCKLLESWLKEVVFPTFRDTADLQLKLGDYYDDPRVLKYLERLEKGGSPLAAAAAIVKLGADAGAAFDTVKSSALETLQKVFPLGKSQASLRVKNSDARPAIAHPLEERHYHLHYDNQHEAAGDPTIENVSSSPFKDAGKIPSDSWDEGEERNDSSSSLAKILSPVKLQNLNSMQVIFTGIAVSALAFAGWRTSRNLQTQHLMRRSPPSVTIDTTSPGSIEGSLNDVRRMDVEDSRPVEESLKDVSRMDARSADVVSVEESVEDIPKMDARIAEDIVCKWQAAKRLALGPSHVVQLDEVLSGQMLKSWVDRARDVARNGWYWEYDLLDLSIDSVTISADGRRATVEATLQEAASLYDSSNPEATDSYNAMYVTKYELIYTDDGWKISSGVVLN